MRPMQSLQIMGRVQGCVRRPLSFDSESSDKHKAASIDTWNGYKRYFGEVLAFTPSRSLFGSGSSAVMPPARTPLGPDRPREARRACVNHPLARLFNGGNASSHAECCQSPAPAMTLGHFSSFFDAAWLKQPVKSTGALLGRETGRAMRPHSPAATRSRAATRYRTSLFGSLFGPTT